MIFENKTNPGCLHSHAQSMGLHRSGGAYSHDHPTAENTPTAAAFESQQRRWILNSLLSGVPAVPEESLLQATLDLREGELWHIQTSVVAETAFVALRFDTAIDAATLPGQTARIKLSYHTRRCLLIVTNATVRYLKSYVSSRQKEFSLNSGRTQKTESEASRSAAQKTSDSSYIQHGTDIPSFYFDTHVADQLSHPLLVHGFICVRANAIFPRARAAILSCGDLLPRSMMVGRSVDNATALLTD